MNGNSVPTLSTDEVVIEPKIVDLWTGTEDSTFNNKTLLKDFISPPRTNRPKVREVYQPDGTTITRSFTDRLRHIPDFLLFDTIGHETHELLRQQEEDYYLCAAERDILETKAREISTYIPDNAAIFDLGCGSMEKTKVLIEYLRKSGKKGLRVHGVDIDREHLKNTIAGLMKEQKENKTAEEDEFEFIGVHATFEQIIPFIRKTPGPCMLFFIGGTLGNMYRDEAKNFCCQFQEKAMKPGDCFFIGFDKRKDPKIIARAYQDRKHALRTFCMHGLDVLNGLFGGNTISADNFTVLAGYNDIEGLNEIFYQSLVEQTVTIPAPFSGHDKESVDVHLKKGELIDLIRSFKFSHEEVRELAVHSKLVVADQWSDPRDYCWLTMFKTYLEEEQ